MGARTEAYLAIDKGFKVSVIIYTEDRALCSVKWSTKAKPEYVAYPIDVCICLAAPSQGLQLV